MSAIVDTIKIYCPTFPKPEELDTSKYDIDKTEHSGRLICVIDLCSVAWQFLKEICTIAYRTIAGLGGLALLLFLVPIYKTAAYANKSKETPPGYLSTLDKWTEKVENFTIETLYRVPMDFVLFFIRFAPFQIIKMGGNVIGIAFPEVGRYVRQNANPSEDIIPKYVDWRNSRYEADQKDHLGRIICVVDMFSQLWCIAEKIVEIAGHFLCGLCALGSFIVLAPAAEIASWFEMPKKENQDDDTAIESEVDKNVAKANLSLAGLRDLSWSLMSSNYYSFFHLKNFILTVLPKITVKLVGNGIGVVIPEAGRFVRTNEMLKLPPVVDNTPANPNDPHQPTSG